MALDKWLLTVFCLPQHLAACGPWRTQYTGTLVSESISRTQFQGRVTRSAPSASIQMENHARWALAATAYVKGVCVKAMYKWYR